MNKVARRLVAALALFLFASCSSMPQGQILGSVFREGGPVTSLGSASRLPLQAQVTVVPVGGETRDGQTASTDEEGVFRFDLSPGVYDVTALLDDGGQTTLGPQRVTVVSRQTVRVDLSFLVP